MTSESRRTMHNSPGVCIIPPHPGDSAQIQGMQNVSFAPAETTASDIAVNLQFTSSLDEI